MAELLHLLSDLSPVGVIALLALVIYRMVQDRRGPSNAELASNHLHELPAMSASLARIEELLQRMNDTLTYLKARSNGGK